MTIKLIPIPAIAKVLAERIGKCNREELDI